MKTIEALPQNEKNDFEVTKINQQGQSYLRGRNFPK